MADLQAEYAAHAASMQQRFEQALSASGWRSALVYSGSLTPIFRDDQTQPFRAHAWFKAWAPLTSVPECLILVRPGDKPLLLFHQPADFWYEPAPLPQGDWTRHFELRAVPDLKAARAALPESLGQTAFIGELPSEARSWGLGAINPQELLLPLDFSRAVKTSYELSMLRAASRSAAVGHRAAAAAFKAGATEFEIHQAFLNACDLREQELPYNAIVALNEAGAVLHYQNLRRQKPAAHHSLLIDAGTEFNGYASDVTRTWSYGDSDFNALIAAADAAQLGLCAKVRAGVDWRDIHLASHLAIAAVLRQADIIRCEPEQALESGVSSVFLPHGIGHLLGLQVHDVGGWQKGPEGGQIPRPEGHPYLRLTRVLEPGYVVTMEPGLYFIEPLLAEARADARSNLINWPRVEAFKRFGGIRIEDNLAVTATGCENLTRDAFAAAA